MPISININGENATQVVNELVGFITNLHGTLNKLAGGTLPAGALVPAAAEPAKAEPAKEPAAEPAKKAPAGKKAAEKAAPAAPPVQEVTLPESEEATLDNARAWIQAINAKFGLDDVAKIITSFGVKKVGEIDPSKFADFIAKCKTQLTGETAPAAAVDVASMM